MSARDICCGAEREISGVRGCGPLRGRRQTKHLGQVDLDVWTSERNSFGGQRSVSFTVMRKTDGAVVSPAQW